jgi:hypothetical protein
MSVPVRYIGSNAGPDGFPNGSFVGDIGNAVAIAQPVLDQTVQQSVANGQHDPVLPSAGPSTDPPTSVVAYSGLAAASGTQAHLVINVNYDPSVTVLQTTDPTLYNEYTSAVQTAVQYFENEFINPITVDINFGWQEYGATPNSPAGSAIPALAIGASTRSEDAFSYPELYAALKATDATSEVQLAAVASLATVPTAFQDSSTADFAVATAEAKALGLIEDTDSGSDGSVGLGGSASSWSWSQTSVSGGTYDPVGVLEHEISEVLGRTATGGAGGSYNPLDLFRWKSGDGLATDAPGRVIGGRDEPFSPATYDPAAFSYFSYDGTNVTLPFDNPTDVTTREADVGDWAPSVPNDAFGYATQGQPQYVTTTDLQEMNVLGYDLTGSVIIAPATLVTMIEAPGATLTVQSSPASSAGTSQITWTGTITSNYSIPTTDWTGYATNMDTLLTTFDGATDFSEDKTLAALFAPGSYTTLAIGEPSYSGVSSVSGLNATDKIAYAFSSPIPSGASFLLWAPGGSYALTSNGQITASDVGPFTFTVSATLAGAAVSMSGWTMSVETPTGKEPVWNYSANPASGTVTVTTIATSAPFPDAVIVITPNTPVDAIQVSANTISDDTWGFAIPTTITSASSPNLPVVTLAYQSILRTAAPSTSAAQTAAQLDTGQTTLAQYESNLITSEQALYTTVAALVTIDAFYNATPSSGNLTTVATATSGTSYYSAAELHNLGYSDTNVWTVLASGWGADPGSEFYALYDADATGTTAGYTAFINAVYTREFGSAPTASNLQNLLADVPGTQALLNGGGHVATPIQVMAGLYGYLLEVGQTNNVGQYASATTAFLVAAANGNAIYGPELTAEFPANSTTTPPVMAARTADPNVITVTDSNQLVDPGVGSYNIQFLSGTGADTLMVRPGGTDQLTGFNVASDVLDLRPLLAGTGLDLIGDISAMAGYLSVVDQGTDALLRFDPTGMGGGNTVVRLQGLGSTVTSLDTLTAHAAVRDS